MINSYSDCLAGILVDSSRRVVKYKRPDFTKPHWSEELSNIKTLSVQAHNLWSLNGCPSYGMLNDNIGFYVSQGIREQFVLQVLILRKALGLVIN